MPYTLAQAARAIGRNKTSVLRAIKSGKISAIRDEATGGWLIEPAELHRLYPPAADAAPAAGDAIMRNGDATERSGDSVERGDRAAVRNGDAAAGTAALRAQLDQERAERLRERADKDAVIDDLRRRLDTAEEERRTTLRQLTALLTDQRSEQIRAVRKRRWWRFGKRD
jgi:hypothetical protein